MISSFEAKVKVLKKNKYKFLAIFMLILLVSMICLFVFSGKKEQKNSSDRPPVGKNSGGSPPIETGKPAETKANISKPPISTKQTTIPVISKKESFECSYIEIVRKGKNESPEDMKRMITDLKTIIDPPGSVAYYFRLRRTTEEIVDEAFTKQLFHHIEHDDSEAKIWYYSKYDRVITEKQREKMDKIHNEVNELRSKMKHAKSTGSFQNKMPGFQEQVSKLAKRIILTTEEVLAQIFKSLNTLRFDQQLLSITKHPIYYLELITKSIYSESKNFQIILIHLDDNREVPSDFSNKIDSLNTYLKRVGDSDIVCVFVSGIYSKDPCLDSQEVTAAKKALDGFFSKWGKGKGNIHIGLYGLAENRSLVDPLEKFHAP